ncbi:sensor histidine kinase [Humibacter antri]
MIDPRWRTILTFAPYLVLGMLTAFAVGTEWGVWARLVPTLILCAAYGAWVLVMRNLPFRWRDRPSAIAVFIAGAIALNLALVLLEGSFGFLTIATFTFAYSLVEWPWELLAVGATAVVAGLAQGSSFGLDTLGFLGRGVVVALNVVIMCGLSWGLRLAQRQDERAATAAERARLAREIHDTLAQRFAGIVTQLQAADQAPDDDARRRHSDAAIELARDGLAEARRSVQALRPAALDAVRLHEALRNVAASWSARTGIPVDFRASGDGRGLTTDAEVALLRTTQEALANVERHAGARRVVLTMRSDASGTRLEVRDDGRGFDPAERHGRDPRPEEGGYGLVAMRERIESVAGALVVDSRPGHGTAVRAQVPA